MRIAVTAENAKGLSSNVCPHFGHAPYFVLADLDENQTALKVKSVRNPYFQNHAPGQIPAFVNSEGAQVIISGGMGAGAVSYFNQYGIKTATGAEGTVGQAIEAFIQGKLGGDATCDHHPGDHH